MKTEHAAAYRREGRYWLIELSLSDMRQFFNSLDPSPFPEKDIDDEIENYLVESVREFHLKTPLRLVIHVPGDELGRAAQTIPESVRHYFDYRAQGATRELRYCLRLGRTSLFVGLAFLSLCMVGSELAGHFETVLGRVLQEGLIIGGWVAMWRPIQIFLYDWWPIARRRRVYQKLTRMEVEIRVR